MQTTVNGFTLAYTDEGAGLPLVFVHGFPLSGGTWRHQVDAFRGTHRVIAPDLRGLGESTGAGAVSTMDQFADDLRALLDQLKVGPAVVAGHSMGGYVTLAFARMYPGLVRGLVLVGTRSGPDSPEAAAGRRATAEKVRAQGAGVVVDAMAPKMIAPSNPDPAMAAAVRGFMAPSRPDGVCAALLGMADRPDSTGMLKGIAVPTLVITGADDVLIPPGESMAMAAAIPGAQLVVIPAAGHLVAFEQPTAFNRALTAWLVGNGM